MNQLRRSLRHEVRIEDATPVAGISSINTEQASTLAALKVKKSTLSAQISVLEWRIWRVVQGKSWIWRGWCRTPGHSQAHTVKPGPPAPRVRTPALQCQQLHPVSSLPRLVLHARGPIRQHPLQSPLHPFPIHTHLARLVVAMRARYSASASLGKLGWRNAYGQSTSHHFESHPGARGAIQSDVS